MTPFGRPARGAEIDPCVPHWAWMSPGELDPAVPQWARVLTDEQRVISYDILLEYGGCEGVCSTFVV
eukprot:10566853-Heterocapsa_arctica.AAC.1